MENMEIPRKEGEKVRRQGKVVTKQRNGWKVEKGAVLIEQGKPASARVLNISKTDHGSMS